jgi:hypothetical protein
MNDWFVPLTFMKIEGEKFLLETIDAASWRFLERRLSTCADLHFTRTFYYVYDGKNK